jgi:hypothetical protein
MISPASLKYESDVRLIRWGESSSAGRTITIELPPGDGEVHPFRGFPVGHAHGQRFRMLFEPIGDDEKPVDRIIDHEGKGEEDKSLPHGSKDATRSMVARDRYAAMPEGKQAVARAGALAADERFQEWLELTGRTLQRSEDIAARYIRECCGVQSRSEIADDPEALESFMAIETSFQVWRGGYVEIER